MINFLCPNTNLPTGGIKTLYRATEILNNHGIDSCIYHIQNTNYNIDWISHTVKLRDNDVIDPYKDFMVVPEIYVAEYGSKFLYSKIKYAIFVQNQFYIHACLNSNCNQLKEIYEGADLIIVTSESLKDDIQFYFPGIDNSKFTTLIHSFVRSYKNVPKTKTITYMPKHRLPKHVEFLIFLLKDYFLPNDWRLVKLENLSESKVSTILSESVIHLSFSDLEGLGMVNVEAAMHENIVIGYTGWGGKEFFAEPLFYEIEPNDFKKFISRILETINKFETNTLYDNTLKENILYIRNRYSQKVESDLLLKFSKKVNDIMKTII